MSSFRDAWQKAGEEPDKFEPPTGPYKVKITGGSAFTSRKGEDYAKVDLQILEGDHAGRQVEHFMGFANEIGARINREALLAYGLQNEAGIETVDDLNDAIVALTGTEADIHVSYNDREYMQIKVHGSRTGQSDIPSNGFEGVKPGEPAQPSFSAAAGAKADDDIPW